MEKTPNRLYKSHLFVMIFEDKEKLLELYNAVSGSDYRDPELLEINTLENAIYMSMKNDISFLLTSGKLNEYLADVDKQAKECFERLVEQMKQPQDITEQLKSENALEWVQKMNCIRACAIEVVNNEIIYA